MTLIVGIRCKTGVVIAADQQATHGGMGTVTVGQPITKSQLFGGDTLFAASGHAGLGQQLGGVIKRRRSNFKGNNYDAEIREVQSGFRSILVPAFDAARAAAPTIGQHNANEQIACTSLLAAQFKDQIHLVEISPIAMAESIVHSMPFVSLGSGKSSADPFLGFLRRVFWPSGSPTIEEGVLAAYWTIKHSIDMRVIGVGFSVDVFVLEDVGGKVSARQLDEAVLAEHDGFIVEAEEALRSVGRKLSQPLNGTPAISAPPVAPRP